MTSLRLLQPSLTLPSATLLLAIALLSPVRTSAADPVDFGRQVYPILQEHCLSCHGPAYVDAASGRSKKPKGGLRLDTHEWIMKGFLNDNEEQTAVVIPGKPDKSTLYTSTTLDPDHDDIMPANGDPLSKSQQELLKDWIAQGAQSNGFQAPAYSNPKAKK